MTSPISYPFGRRPDELVTHDLCQSYLDFKNRYNTWSNLERVSTVKKMEKMEKFVASQSGNGAAAEAHRDDRQTLCKAHLRSTNQPSDLPRTLAERPYSVVPQVFYFKAQADQQ